MNTARQALTRGIEELDTFEYIVTEMLANWYTDHGAIRNLVFAGNLLPA